MNIYLENERANSAVKLALVVYGEMGWNDQLLGSGGQRSRSHAEVRFGDLAEASFSWL